MSVQVKRETTMKDDEKEKLERVIRRMEAFASEVKLAERFCLKFSVVTFVAWIVMIFIFRLEVSSEVSSVILTVAVWLFGINVLLRQVRISILSILNDLNELL